MTGSLEGMKGSGPSVLCTRHWAILKEVVEAGDQAGFPGIAGADDSNDPCTASAQKLRGLFGGEAIRASDLDANYLWSLAIAG
ncbi:MAG: hypothetical protein WBK19_01340 [Azonexus sp.]